MESLEILTNHEPFTGDTTFLISHVTSCDHMIKGHITLGEGFHHLELPLCQIWCLCLLETEIWIFIKWHCRTTWSKKCGLIGESQHFAKFDTCTSCVCGDETIPISNATLCDLVMKCHEVWWISGLKLQNLTYQCMMLIGIIEVEIFILSRGSKGRMTW